MAKPTYEIAGQVERFDERDTVFARQDLVLGSREETLYHELNPGLQDVDLSLQRFLSDKMNKSEAAWGRAYYQAVFSPISHLAFPNCVDGVAACTVLGGSNQQNSAVVKALSIYLGADLVGIGPLRQEWVYTHKGRGPFFEESPPSYPPFIDDAPQSYTGRCWGEAVDLPHRNVIALGFSQNLEIMKTGPTEATDLEIGKVYARSALVACELARFIRSLGYPARAHHVRNYCVLVVPAAVDAGLGELARSGYLLSKTFGLNLRLSCVTTDMPLGHDDPVDIGVQDFCNKCLKCARNCPTGAIPSGEKRTIRGIRKWQISAEKCFGYWAEVGSACMICQVVCPWTKPPTLFHKSVAHVASTLGWTRKGLVLADDIFYSSKYKKKEKPSWML